ncbi:MAG: NAD+ synthase, partial [Planctomycetota bacterium]
MRIALAQLDPTVGDVAGNTEMVLASIDRARGAGADLLVCTELVLIGYPPLDLLLREGVVEACEQAVREIARHTREMVVIVGHPRRAGGGVRPLRNSASVCRDGEIVAVHDKRLLPGYDVFDEDRYFDCGNQPVTVEVAGSRVGVLICEDLWRAGDVRAERHYAAVPVADLVGLGCDVLVSLDASPYVAGKWQRHIELLRDVVSRHGVTVVAVNQVGGNDDLIFDGRSIAVGPEGDLLAVLPGWKPAVETIDLAAPPASEANLALQRKLSEPMREVFGALVLGVKDYCRKVGHAQVLLGISGGVDSALTATIASAALGPENVIGLMLPSRYTLPESRRDAVAVACNLGLARLDEMPIESAHTAMQEALAAVLPADGGTSGVVDENIQARLRGIMLMAVSNATGALVLATSNKSEFAAGYCTIYGDMCGALAVLGDVTKTRIYQLARWMNENHAECGFEQPPIPVPCLEKPPSA